MRIIIVRNKMNRKTRILHLNIPPHYIRRGRVGINLSFESASEQTVCDVGILEEDVGCGTACSGDRETVGAGEEGVADGYVDGGGGDDYTIVAVVDGYAVYECVACAKVDSI
jgi:hypothetical protein